MSARNVLRCGGALDCDEQVSCIGQYEAMTRPEPSCSVHCAHGNEDGRCVPINASEEPLLAWLLDEIRRAHMIGPDAVALCESCRPRGVDTCSSCGTDL